MRVLVTGSNGKVGTAIVAALLAAGHVVKGTDRASLQLSDRAESDYVQADLGISGDAYAVVHGFDAVVHTAALPRPSVVPSHVVFQNNVMTTFNVVAAVARAEIPLLVNISSVAVLGHGTAASPFEPEYLPVDEQHPLRPREPYALSKLVGEQVVTTAVEASDLRAVSLRPPWIIAPESYADDLLPAGQDARELQWSYWSYVDVRDLAEAVVASLAALTVSAELAKHEVLLVAAIDNALGRPLRELALECFGDSVTVRPQATGWSSGVSSDRAKRLLGYSPRYSWRDILDNPQPKAYTA